MPISYKFRGSHTAVFSEKLHRNITDRSLGRFYTYPERFISSVICPIPVNDAAEYEKWLHACLYYFSCLEANIEKNVRSIKPINHVRPLSQRQAEYFAKSCGLQLQSCRSQLSSPNAEEIYGTTTDIKSSENPWSETRPTSQILLRRLACLETLPSAMLPLKWLWIGSVNAVCFDLDREVFSVDNFFHFPLNKIPQEWKNIVRQRSPVSDHSKTGKTYRFHPGIEVPEVGLISVLKPVDKIVPTEVFRPSKVRYITAKPVTSFARGKQNATRFARRLFKSMTSLSKAARWEYFSFCSVTNQALREVVHAILCLASGSPEYLAFAQAAANSVEAQQDNFHYGLLLGRHDCIPEVVSCLTSGVHAQGNSPNSAPETNDYWFEGVMICLWDSLDNESSSQAAVTHVIERGYQQHQESFYAIIISSKHAIVLEVLPNREVVQTWPLILIGDDELEKSDSNYGAFVAIAQILEAARMRSLDLWRYSDQRNLPSEIIANIVMYADRKTRISLSAASKRFRYECQRVCVFFGDYILTDDHGICSLRSGCDLYMLQDGPGRIFMPKDDAAKWIPVIGNKSSTRSFISDAAFRFALPREPGQEDIMAYLEACF